MKCGCLYFHQGWTDIMNQLSLINYYQTKYDEINIIMRNDASEMLNFYIRNLTGVSTQYIPLNGYYKIPHDYDILFHGLLDSNRSDKYKNKFIEYCRDPNKYKIFSEGFYTAYDIDHNVKVDYFNIVRNLEDELQIYNEIIKKHGKDYIIYHDDPTNKIGISTSINCLSNRILPKINLNQISPKFFNLLHTIYNAQEIHLVDSVWASLCYQMDARYGFFDHKEIKVYAQRGYQLMFEMPKKLKNWTII